MQQEPLPYRSRVLLESDEFSFQIDGGTVVAGIEHLINPRRHWQLIGNVITVSRKGTVSVSDNRLRISNSHLL